MMFSNFASGFGLSAALIIPIGAQNAFVLRQGIRREHVGAVVSFCAAADIILMAVGVIGAGAVLTSLSALSIILTASGAAFLLLYGLSALRRAIAPRVLAAEPGMQMLGLGAVLTKAAGFTFLNPHVYLDTVVLMGTVGDALAPAGRVLFIGGAGSASSLWFVALGFGVRLLAPWFAKPMAWRILDALIAIIMLSLAVALAFKLAGDLALRLP